MDMRATVRRQPVITVGVIVSAVAALVVATNAFGLTTVTDEQRDALTGAIIAMWPVLGVIWALVTPAASPRLDAGTPVQLPDGTDGTVTRT